MYRSSSRVTKIILSVLAFMVGTQLFAYGLFRPVPVQAQLPVTITSDIPTTVGGAVTAALLGTLINGASYMLRKLAYDSASYLASGAAGQKPLVFQKPAGEYFEELAGNAAGTMIEELGKPFGLNLCKPPDLSFQLNLQVSLSRIYEKGSGPEPTCNWNSFKENWGNIDEMYNQDTLAERFSGSLSVTEGAFGTALQAKGAIDRNILKEKEAGMLERMVGNGFKPVQDLVSGNIKTPAATVKDESEALGKKHQGELNATQVAGIYGQSSWQVLLSTASIFLNTFASQFLHNMLTDGLIPSPTGEGVALTDQFAQQININREAAQAAYSYLITGKTMRDEGTYDTIARYSTCPDNPALDNCVIDNDFVRALTEARAGDPLTIQEAIDKTWLHGNWQLIPPSRTDLNEDVGCRTQAYCYSNIQKLRKMRILPLGFEIAALKSDPDQPVTLQQAVDGFNACNDAKNPTPDSSFPYCHLIDPNWILKAPIARQEQKVHGPQLLSESLAQRKEEYIDVKTCLQKDENGKCISYGYCTEEQNTWVLQGDTCPAQFATCQTFTSQDGLRASYLTRTLDYGMCNAESVGCQPYSLEKDVDGNWQNSVSSSIDTALKADYGRNQIAYFNDNIEQYSCPASEDGCSDFTYGTDNTGHAYIKKAPDYLGCYDIDSNETNGIQWPETQADLALLGDVPEQCNNYAQVCLEEEVGCDEYTPSDGSTALTAVGGVSCAESCVGYETFRQRATAFEESQFPLYFIPNNGDTCSAQDVGCDQFVDLSASTGEIFNYFTDIVACRLPDGDNGKIFYTWEGTESDGYVLKKFNLLQTTQEDFDAYADGSQFKVVGSPRYDDDSAGTLTNYDSLCNETAYNILLENPYATGAANTDCRKFIDNAGEEYYRLLDELVLIDSACKRYRKVDANFTKDQNGNFLTETNGDLICTNGGTFNSDNDTCEYWTLAQPRNSCSAAANQCRTYVGNTGNNIVEIYSTSFEPDVVASSTALIAAKEGWAGNTSVEPEATQVGLHSLRVNDQIASYEFATSTFITGVHYEVTFWARALQPLGLTVMLEQGGASQATFTLDPITGQDFPVSVTSEWQSYRVGPIPFDGDGMLPTVLKFESNNSDVNASYYLDNIRVVGAGVDDEDYVHLIKNSWKEANGDDVPAVCDANPLDQFPGAALGCQEYTKRNGGKEVVQSLTGFQNLCRAEAVSCLSVTDVQNRFGSNNTEVNELDGEKVAYNVYCERATIGDDTAQISCDVTVNSEEYKCNILSGEPGCYIEGPMNLATTTIAGTTIPQDNPPTNTDVVLKIINATNIVPAESDIIYLTQENIAIEDSYLCSRQYVGCQEVGKERKVLPGTEQQAYEYSSGYYTVNNPAHYTSTLCVEEQVGCERFSADSQESYFKDPQNASTQYCVWRDNVTISGDGQVYDGWFLDGIGTCSNDDDQYCRIDDDCDSGNTCTNVGTTACYPNYVQPGPTYGVWSNGSDSYDGRVALCGAQYSGCTELIDPANLSGGPDGTSYHVIKNNKLFSDLDSCNGQVSQKDGCVLFDDTTNPNKPYDSMQTYDASESQNYNLVPIKTVTSTDGDANTLLKVGRDRQCREWLACQSSVTVTTETNSKVTLCDEYDACNQLNNDGSCGNWVNNENDISRFTEDKYIGRDVSWEASEYSGYSLYNKYNPAEYTYIFVDDDDAAYMAYQMPDSLFVLEDDPTTNADDGDVADALSLGCFEQVQGKYVNFDGDVCGVDDGGRCYQQRCLYPIDGTFENTPKGHNSGTDTGAIKDNVDAMISNLNRASCKNYPEKESPYPWYLLADNFPKNPTDNNKGFYELDGKYRREYRSKVQGPLRNANVCQIFDGKEKQDCSCDYIKVEYRDGTIDYWPQKGTTSTADVIPDGVCSGVGEKAGNVCSVDSACNPDNHDDTFPNTGTCSKIKSETYNYGLKGLCLEYDRSRPLGLIRDESRLYDSFACMTWLPIEVSASKIDIYNSHQEAGYDLTLDAQPWNFGQLYCLDGTMDGKYYDENMKYSDDILSTIYDDISLEEFWIEKTPSAPLKNNGLSGLYLVKEGIDCDEFVSFFRGPAGDDWEHDGNGCDDEATRINLTCDSIKNADYHYLFGNNHGFSGKKNVSKFVEKICKDDMTDAYRSLQAWAWKMYGDNAIVLRIDEINNPKFAPKLGQNEQQTTITDPSSSFSKDKQYTSVFENNLNESDIENLCFVPIMVPGGYHPDSFEPALMEERICISFRNLQKNKNNLLRIDKGVFSDYHGKNGFDRSEQDYWAYMPGILDWKDYFFVNDDDMGYDWDDIDFPLDREINKSYVWTYYENDNTNNINRYVAVIYDSDDDNTKSAVDGFPFTKDFANITSPFSEITVNTNQKSWLAIAAEFNANTGKFLRYKSKYYHGSPNESGISFATIATIYNKCVDFVSVYDDSANKITGSTNKAYTEKTWESYTLDTAKRLTPRIPYGSLPLQSKDIDDDIKLRKFSFFDSSSNYLDGVPIDCNSSWNNLFMIPPEGCNIYYQNLNKNIYSNLDNSDSSYDALHRIFANYYNRKLFAANTQTYTKTSQLDVSNNLANTSPPKIHAINPLTCASGLTAGGTDCSAGQQDAFTINNRNYSIEDYDNNKLLDEDSNNNNGVDPIIADGSYKATAKFFAYADDNHMPIRRVMVNWDDGNIISGQNKKGLYKNRKPFCGDTDGKQNRCENASGETQMTCNPDYNNRDCILAFGAGYTCQPNDDEEKNFGDADRACTQEYFEYNHTYGCDASQKNITVEEIRSSAGTYFETVQDAEDAYNRLRERRIQDGDTLRPIKDSDNVCIYKPKVQVLDNWGWCNGVDQNGDYTGYYNEVIDPATGFKDDECDGDASWTPYKGSIIVIPN